MKLSLKVKGMCVEEKCPGINSQEERPRNLRSWSRMRRGRGRGKARESAIPKQVFWWGISL